MPDSQLTFARVSQMIRPAAAHRLLFAFDVLMDADTIAERVPDSKFVCVARMQNRRFMVNSDGIASIGPGVGFDVLGVVWEVGEVAMSLLDLQLGVPGDADRFGAFTRTLSGTLIVSEHYRPRNRQPGSAHPDCLAVIVTAARVHGFPEEYVENIQRWDVDQRRRLAASSRSEMWKPPLVRRARLDTARHRAEPR